MPLDDLRHPVDRSELFGFLDARAAAMPWIMLSYAIEHLGADQRARIRSIPRADLAR